MGRMDVMYFTSLLWATGWSAESDCCAHTYVLVYSLAVMENWAVNHHVLAVRTYLETVQTRDVFGGKQPSRYRGF
jgi:hypothetical protein